MAKEDTQFKKGNPGRPKGAENKFTKTVRETVLEVFNQLQEDPKHSLAAFAKDNPTEFYKIASKLIPTDLKAELTGQDGQPTKFEITLKI